MATIAIIGTGYVGLTSGACFAHLGHDVVCADVDTDKVARLSAGEVRTVEVGLGDLVAEGRTAGRLRFTDDVAEAVAGREVVVLCVPTPHAPDGSVDLSAVEAAATAIGPALEPGAVVVDKSTVPVGTTHLVAGLLDRDDVTVASNPEFLREGTAVADFLGPDRIVIGADDDRTREVVRSLYDGVDAPVVLTDPASAETIKYAANAFLVTKLSFANAIAAVCEAVGADIDDVSWASVTTTASGPATCAPVRAGVAVASPRTPGPSFTRPDRPATTSGSWTAPSRSTASSSTAWWTRSAGPLAVTLPDERWPSGA